MNKNLSKILLLASIGAMPLGMAAQQASSFVFSGKVKDIKGKGIAGVVVNNGRSFVQTNSLGEWTLPTDTNVCKFVSISTPSSYVLPCQKSLADTTPIQRQISCNIQNDKKLRVNANMYSI